MDTIEPKRGGSLKEKLERERGEEKNEKGEMMGETRKNDAVKGRRRIVKMKGKGRAGGG